MKEWNVEKNALLLEYLYEVLTDYPKKKVKSFLGHGNILVNNKVVTKFNYPLKKNDIVRVILGKTMYQKAKPNGINIIYEDSDFLVINKPYGLLSVATDKEKEKTAYHLVREHINNNSNDKLFILHRLDRETSGVLVFVKSEKLKEEMQENWNELVKVREYTAIVEGAFEEKSGTLESYLLENKSNIVYSTKNKKEGKLAITDYVVKKSKNDFSLVTLLLKTGRKNQIRVQMSDFGHPIIGDKKYGAKNSPIKRLALHASRLEFINPRNNKLMSFETPVPKTFTKLV